MQAAPTYQDVTREVNEFFTDRLSRLAAAGVTPDQVVLDVGIGFGKTVEHNWQLLTQLRSFTRLHRPLLLGVSRKSFIPKVSGESDTADRFGGSLACACWGVQHGIHIVRTHDVAATRQALLSKFKDGEEANTLFETLMGDVVEPRREFIQDNALDAEVDV